MYICRRIITSLCIFFIEQLFFIKIEAKEICKYRTGNSTSFTNCDDDCCSSMADSIQAACCSSISWRSLAIPFFIIAGVFILAICLLYCRPAWKMCLCGYKCPFINRTRVTSPNSMPSNDNPVYEMNNDDLPDYETIIKDSSIKDVTPPPYNFVAAHPNDFGIEARVPSAPPQYNSRRNSLTTTTTTVPVET